MALTLLPPGRRDIVQAYGGGGFRIGGRSWQGAVLLLPERTVAWPVTDFTALAPEHFESVIASAAMIELLVVGCGPRLCRLPEPLRAQLRATGIVVEMMDTGAACRTFNVLVAEDRRVAGGLIALA